MEWNPLAASQLGEECLHEDDAVCHREADASNDHAPRRTSSVAVIEERNTTTTPYIQNSCATFPMSSRDPNFSDVDHYDFPSYLHFNVSVRPVQKDTFMTGTEL